jgi:hypothetical protein
LHDQLSNQTAGRLKKLYDTSQAAVESKLRKAMRAGRGESFTAHQARIVLTQLRHGQAEIATHMAKAMKPALKKAQSGALHGLVKDVTRLHKKFTGAEITVPIEKASRFAGVIDQRETSLLAMNTSSMQRYGVHVVMALEDNLAQSLMTGSTPDDAIDAVMDTIGGEWWQGERIVRTELAWADNAAISDGLRDMSKDFPDIRQRWEEYCDADGEPMDDRVGVDSIAMHGQVAAVGGLFTMPATSPFPDAKGKTDVPKSLVGRSWEFPPNRPNDRSVMSPWMKRWGIPGWQYLGGRRVPL